MKKLTETQQIAQNIVNIIVAGVDSPDFFRGVRCFKNKIREKYELELPNANSLNRARRSEMERTDYHNKITGHIWTKWGQRGDDKIHIKNFERYESKTYCGRDAWSQWGNSGIRVDWVYPKNGDLRDVTCVKCKNQYLKRFSKAKDLSFKTFENKDFRGVDFRDTSIIGCRFYGCKLDGAKVNSLALVNSELDPYKLIPIPVREGGGYVLLFTGIWPQGRETPNYGPPPLGHCLGLRGD